MGFRVHAEKQKMCVQAGNLISTFTAILSLDLLVCSCEDDRCRFRLAPVSMMLFIKWAEQAE